MPHYIRDSDRLELLLQGSQVLRREQPGQGPLREVRIDCEGEAHARWEYDRQVALALAAGYHRQQGEAAPALLRNPELEAAIHAAPDDGAAYLVYADWLQARGDPWGELICVQHAIAEHRRYAATQAERFFSEQALRLERAELLLLMHHRERLLGPLLSRIYHLDGQLYFSDLFDLTWRLGFVQRAALRRSLRREGNDQHLWRALLDSPAGALLRHAELDWADLPQLIWPAPPQQLVRLELELSSWWPPEREQQARRADEEPDATLEELVGPPAAAGGHVVEMLRPLVLVPPPRLRELVLQGCAFGPELLTLLSGSPLLRQLRVLDLSRGSLGDAQLEQLRQLAPELRGLERLDLRRNRFSPKGRGQLARLGLALQLERAG